MTNSKGFSLTELLVVLIIIILVTVSLFGAVSSQIDQARGSAMAAEARMVYQAAKIVLVEESASGSLFLSDRDLAAGLGGTSADGEDWPAQVRLSRRMNDLLAPDIVLGIEASGETARAEFQIRDGVLLGLDYEAEMSGRVYRVSITEGEDAVVERVRGR